MKKILFGVAIVVAALVVWMFLLFAMAFVDANAADYTIGDLKSVTIRFKNDSELKLKTQWFINACDTTKNIVWVKHQYWDSAGVPYDLAEKDRQGLKYEWVMQDRGLIRWQVIDTTVICRTLLFSPEIRKEPVIRNRGSTYRNPCDSLNYSYADTIFCEPDTIPGEAIIFYKPYKEEQCIK